MSIDAERLRRLRECWQDDAPNALELARAARRFEARRSSHRAGFVSWAIAGASAGVVAMLALSPTRSAPSSAPAHGSITAEPTAVPAPAMAPAPEVSESVVAPPEKPMRPKPIERPRSAGAKTTEIAELTPKGVRDEASLRAAPRWLAVGRGPESEPVITGLEQQKKAIPPGN